MRGPKPLPTHLKLMKNSHPERINKAEPKPKKPKACPLSPEDLTGDARKEWDRVSEELYQMGLLTGVDQSVLAAYCEMRARWREAERGIKEIGLTVQAGNGTTIPNPLVGIANKAASDMVKYAIEFGMTPSARSRIKAGEVPEEDPAEKYLVP
jgi:P27 family predicted phage terminase small subunit